MLNIKSTQIAFSCCGSTIEHTLSYVVSSGIPPVNCKKPLNHVEISAKVRELYEDSYVYSKRGIYEYVLGGCSDTKLLNIRIFDDATKKTVYARQTSEAQAEHKSNCPHCVLENKANKSRIWKINEMDADHVSAWSKGGATDISNCQMLCKTHNRMKGNR